MFVLFNRYLDLVLMRLPPQAFPASGFLLGVTAVTFFVVAVLASLVLSGSAWYAVLRALLSIATLAGFAEIALAFAGRTVRWQQTVTALFGGETVIGLVQLPVLLAWSSGIENVFIALSLLAFLAWELVFLAHVYRNAFDRGMGTGMLVALAYVLAAMMIEQVVLPLPQTEPVEQGETMPGEAD